MPDDALSAVLRAVHLSGSLFFRARLRPPYAVTASGVDEIIEEYAPGVRYMLPFHLVTCGPIWFDVEGTPEPVCLDNGDIIVLPHGNTHSLADRPGQPAVPVRQLDHAIFGDPPTLDWGGDGAPTEVLCGFFHCNTHLFNPLVSALPDVLVIRHDPVRSAWLTATMHRAFDETLKTRAGGSAMVSRLTELLFLEVVQRYLEEGEPHGWLGALQDPVVQPVLAQFHSDPGRPWTLSTLATEVGASRSILAERFTQALGMSPIRYLTAWRMELAAQRLAETSEPITEIAATLGYESEAAFSRAFKRHTGESPAAWRRDRAGLALARA